MPNEECRMPNEGIAFGDTIIMCRAKSRHTLVRHLSLGIRHCIYIFLVFCFLLLSSASTFAADLHAYPSSGGQSSPGFIDNKAEPAIGVIVGPDGTKAELGGIYTFGPGGKPGDFEIVDDEGPQIVAIPVVIEKVDEIGGDGIDDSIKLTWEEPDNLPPGVTLAPLMLIGDGTGLYTDTLSVDNIIVYDQDNPGPFDYDQDKGKWLVMSDDADVATIINVDIDDSNVDNGEIILLGQANGQGIPDKAYYSEFYIKLLLVQGDGMPDFDNPNFQTSFANANCVGKADYTFGTGNNFFTYPFVNTQDINDVFGVTGYAPLSKILDYSKGNDNFNASTLINGQWDNPLVLELGKGYIFYNFGSEVLTTLVGDVKTADQPFAKSITAGNNFVGLPLPAKRTLGQAFTDQPLSLDKFLNYQKATDNFQSINCSTNTVFDDPDYEVSPFKGYLYYKFNGDFQWSPPDQ